MFTQKCQLSMIHHFKVCLIALSLLAVSVPAWSHGMEVTCKAKEKIHCAGTFSDGSTLSGSRVRVLSYKNVVLWTGKVNTKSQVTFKRPVGEFYVQFIADDNHFLEVDHNSIQP